MITLGPCHRPMRCAGASKNLRRTSSTCRQSGRASPRERERERGRDPVTRQFFGQPVQLSCLQSTVRIIVVRNAEKHSCHFSAWLLFSSLPLTSRPSSRWQSHLESTLPSTSYWHVQMCSLDSGLQYANYLVEKSSFLFAFRQSFLAAVPRRTSEWPKNEVAMGAIIGPMLVRSCDL